MSWRKGQGLAGQPWRGATRVYDLLKELTIGLVVMSLIVLVLSALLGSPDDPSVTLKSWANAQPSDFVATATAELAGTSETAGYGPPYNSTPDATQKLGPIDLQSLSGVQLPIDTAEDFVVGPLKTLPKPPPVLADWAAATDKQRTDWATAYSDAIAKAPGNDPTRVRSGDYGPVPAITSDLLAMARQGSLDSVMPARGEFFNLDYTRSILFLGDGSYFPNLASAQHLTGDQWGMMNETGNTPGQSWLWLFSFFYQIEPFASSPNADVLVVSIMLLLSLLLTLVPFVPGLRSIPRWIPVHRLIWRDYYRQR